jgi:hypothetical protein
MLCSSTRGVPPHRATLWCGVGLFAIIPVACYALPQGIVASIPHAGSRFHKLKCNITTVRTPIFQQILPCLSLILIMILQGDIR